MPLPTPNKKKLMTRPTVRSIPAARRAFVDAHTQHLSHGESTKLLEVVHELAVPLDTLERGEWALDGERFVALFSFAAFTRRRFVRQLAALHDETSHALEAVHAVLKQVRSDEDAKHGRADRTRDWQGHHVEAARDRLGELELAAEGTTDRRGNRTRQNGQGEAPLANTVAARKRKRAALSMGSQDDDQTAQARRDDVASSSDGGPDMEHARRDDQDALDDGRDEASAFHDGASTFHDGSDDDAKTARESLPALVVDESTLLSPGRFESPHASRQPHLIAALTQTPIRVEPATPSLTIQAQATPSSTAQAQATLPAHQGQAAPSPSPPRDDTRQLLAHLLPRKWLHTKTVDYFLRAFLSDCEAYHYYDAGNVSPASTPVPVSKGKFQYARQVLAPICHSRHWLLLVFHFEDGLIRIYDSMKGNVQPEQVAQIAQNVGLVVWTGSLRPGSMQWRVEYADMEQQTNGYDCGIFTIVAALHCAVRGQLGPGVRINSLLWRSLLREHLVSRESDHFSFLLDQSESATFDSATQAMQGVVAINNTIASAEKLRQDLPAVQALVGELRDRAVERELVKKRSIEQLEKSSSTRQELARMIDSRRPVAALTLEALAMVNSQDWAFVDRNFDQPLRRNKRIHASLHRNIEQLSRLVQTLSAFGPSIDGVGDALRKMKDGIKAKAKQLLHAEHQELAVQHKQLDRARQELQKKDDAQRLLNEQIDSL
ncbi:hypothetical protein P153DRAFT_435810 [Dothidotthia symphoricarpi CBS 119687]|uniref:Ubiquitin-like protease family profile domain-containing protein n=1 Tax=Dothidotthia symphoricarpi CBS 119687 TaxID=1392245 RepID=A0A6A5ZXL4_9PLEO|nr:uncharacterized protein P153DRAFT_435810 [Dothidotthia symphoricarpi CBS 119687]KAF2123643.1 hypothetical protein P153DRAFT_435810 [Dothidotthia symphoricarpi CBS 119687]